MSAAGLRFRELLPEPRRLWIRFAPQGWPVPAGAWLDLARPGLARAAVPERSPGPGAEGAGSLWSDLADEDLEPLDDVVYLPPVPAEDEPARRRLADRLERTGTPVLLQGLLGTAGAAPPAVVDVTAAVLDRRFEELAAAPRAGAVVWPWIPGLGDAEEVWRPALERLTAAGVRTVLAVAVELDAKQRRHLAELEDGRWFDDLFHRGPSPIGPFRRAVAALGLEPLPLRPLPAGPASLRDRRRVAADLIQSGELLVESGDEVEAQACFRCARRLEREPFDLAALTREGNLGLLAGEDESRRRQIEEVLARGRSAVLDELLTRAGLAGAAEGRREG